MSATQNTAYFTAADWKALVKNGVAKKTGSGFVIDSQGLVDVLVSTFTDAPECSTLAEVAEHGYAMDHLVHNIVGLPVDDDRKVPEQGTVEYLKYVDPAEGMGNIIRTKLGARYDHAVQSKMVPKGKYLVATSVKRDFTVVKTGLPVKQDTRVWAIAVSAVLIDKLVLEPEIARAYKRAIHAASNAQARMEAVPESAPLVLAALDAESVAVSSARATAYALAIEGKTPEEIVALNAAISEATDTKVTIHGAALTSGSGDDA